MVRTVLLILLLTISLSASAASIHGSALLVFNHDYGGAGDPAAARSEVESLAEELAALGFTTTLKENVPQGELRFTIEDFARRVPTHGVALFYFRGRMGVADGGVNLLPAINRSNAVTYPETGRASIQPLLGAFADQSGASLSIVMLEGAVADNWRSGLAALAVPHKVFLAQAQQGLAEGLAAGLEEGGMDLPTAIHAAAIAAGGWLTEPWPVSMPGTIRPTSPGIAAGQLAGDPWVSPLGSVMLWCPPRPRANGKGSLSGFWLGKYEVTRREFDLVTPKMPKVGQASRPNDPRDGIRYNDILLFITELNRQERFFGRLPQGWEYALPTSEEWEYASRAGSNGRFYFGGDIGSLPQHANFADRSLLLTGEHYYLYAERSFDDGHARSAPVGSYQSSPWGFHDLYGNLWEWTASDGELQSPVARGCSWVSPAEYCGAGFVQRFPRETERDFIGFRLALRKQREHSEPTRRQDD